MIAEVEPIVAARVLVTAPPMLMKNPVIKKTRYDVRVRRLAFFILPGL
jgi:hypothetical protein